MNADSRRGVVVTTSESTRRFLAECLDSIRHRTKHPVLVVSNLFDHPLASVVNDWNGFELGGVLRGAERFDEFVHLVDTCVVENKEFFEIMFSHRGSMYLCDGFGSYLGKYRKDILRTVGVPKVHTKDQAIDMEKVWHAKYLRADPEAAQFQPPLPVSTTEFTQKHGRRNMILKNGYVTKYKATWRRTVRTEQSYFVEQLRHVLDWRQIGAVLNEVDWKSMGELRFRPLTLLRAVMLQHCYRLLDAQCQELVADRKSWRQFVGLSVRDEVPDETDLRWFRNKLVERGLNARLLGLCDQQLREKGLMLKCGTIGDAGIMPFTVTQPEAPAPVLSAPTVVPKRVQKQVRLFFFTPYSSEGNLGKAYNSYMQLVPRDTDWVCFVDRDVMFMTSDYGSQIAEIIGRNPGIGLLTCLTNRIGCRSQLYKGRLSEDADVIHHRDIAADLQQKHRYDVKMTAGPVSGFLMVVKKAVWRKVKFSRNLKLLHVDWDFCKRLLAKGHTVGVMQGVYVFHYYRLKEGAAYTGHLT